MANFVYLDPNVLHDLHDGTDQEADAWLRRVAPQILARKEFAAGGDGQLWIIFGEGQVAGGADVDTRCAPDRSQCGGGRLVVAALGPQLKKGYVSSNVYDQLNVLSTWSGSLKIAAPNQSASAVAMGDFFR